MSRPFTFPGRYPATGGNAKYAPEMALKVAESMSLRRAFDVTGIASAVEVQDARATLSVARDVPSFEAMEEWNARLRALSCRDASHRGWATAILLDRPDAVASLTELTVGELDRCLAMTDDSLADALAASEGRC